GPAILLIDEKPGIKNPPDGNNPSQYQYGQGNPFDISYDKRFFLSMFHDEDCHNVLRHIKDKKINCARNLSYAIRMRMHPWLAVSPFQQGCGIDITFHLPGFGIIYHRS